MKPSLLKQPSGLLIACCCLWLLTVSNLKAQVVANFTMPDTVCINTPVQVTNTSTGASTYKWNFCVTDFAQTPPTGSNIGNPNGSLSTPVFIDYVEEGGNFYAFVMNLSSGLVRLDFGNSLLNTPTAVRIGQVGVIPNNHAEGLQVVKTAGKWFIIAVGGSNLGGSSPRIVKIELGANITNTNPIGTNWGNIGGLAYPVDLHVFQDAGQWYGFTTDCESNSVIRFSFGTDFSSPPTAVRLGKTGDFNYPTGIFVMKSRTGSWHAFIVNSASGYSNSTASSLARLDFGSSLTNTPSVVNMGNINNTMISARDIYIIDFCGRLIGFFTNNSSASDMVRLDFGTDLTQKPTAVTLGNIGNLNFPHTISKLFRVNNDLYSFIANANNNTLTRLRFEGCSSNAVGNTTSTPAPFVYTTTGIHNVNLLVDAGLPTETTVCKPIVVVDQPVADFSYEQDLCNPLAVTYHNGTLGKYALSWDFGDGNKAGNIEKPLNTYSKYDTYTVKLTAGTGRCVDVAEKHIDIRLQREEMLAWHDTAQCDNKPIKLLAKTGLNYCWTPAATLSNAAIAEPVATPSTATTYFVHTLKQGANMVNNGDFSLGNTGFSSAYNYASYNSVEGQYNVAGSPRTWNPSMQACSDHTGGNGNMLMVNGSPAADVSVWCQTISNITPNKNYVFSAWLQSLHPANPSKLQFYINGKPIGNIFEADPATCNWKQFFMTWNAGSATAANICVVNKNTQIAGNDFALDDIFFGPVTMVYDSVKVAKVTSPDLASVTNQTICAGDTARPVASGALVYHWSPEQFIADPDVAAPKIYPRQSGVYTVKAYDIPSCPASKTFNVTVTPGPDFAIQPAVSDICEGEQVHITASGATRYTWLVNDSPDPVLQGAAVTVTPATTTVYKIAMVHDACNKKDTLLSQVNVTPLPKTNVTVSNVITCAIGEASLLATGGAGYRWFPVEGLSNPAIASPSVSINQTAKYYVEVSNGNCSTTDSVTVIVDENKDKNLYLVPTAFTPNGDGKNDCFGIKHWGQLQNLQLAVYNRWGQQVFVSNNIADCWNGTFKGEPQPTGAYVYIISATALCGPVLRQGTVLLIR
ncbi:T9SS type B sorting domain-containing protein [Filimonas effusa]|uniref:T9SS type B sorting domain-containing protein n=1 Tax=Filimonas effusa TaxID=2508721 RepID=A0A4Q1D9N9_9BACT|nr:gliding motility-associated C-terminal domain-containing protein [Filimonas effusa]RXK85930.1 T9SS type B sorting domain-containing protein [Filimonas effusa]